MKIALAYSSSDHLIAKSIEEGLAYEKWEFEHFLCTKDAKDSHCLSTSLINYNGPIILLLSDALLKQTNCMDGILDFFNEKKDHVLAVSLPNKDGSPLALSRIGDLIKYINYWRDKYLSFRNQRREMNLENDEAFQVHLDTVRNISKEIGEFLRYFKDNDSPTLSIFKKDDFKSFFEFIEAPLEWESFIAKRNNDLPSISIEPEEQVLMDEDKEVEELLSVELADIPGISLLSVDPPEEAKIKPLSEGEILFSKINSDQGNASHYYNYAVYCLEKGNEESRAKEYFDITLKIDPKHAFAWIYLAKIFNSNGQSDLATQAYKNAVINNPDIETSANDILFGIEKNIAPSFEAHSGADPYDAALDALKANIEKLSELIKIKNEENKRLELQRLKEQEIEKPGKGNVVLISGATSGIGKASAILFAQNGFDLILTGRRTELLETFCIDLTETHEIQVKSLVFDITNAEAVKKAIGSLRGKWRDIDVLINNAGKAKGLAPIHEGKLEHWDEMIDTNIKGMLYLTRIISPWMVKRKSGMIINLCSSAGHEVYPNGAVYCASKYAVDALTKGMRFDLHMHNIRVGQVSPGHVEETEFAEVRFDGNKSKAKIYNDFLPLKSSDVADAIYYMATRPPHVNIQDVVLFGTQQASNMICDKSGRGETK